MRLMKDWKNKRDYPEGIMRKWKETKFKFDSFLSQWPKFKSFGSLSPHNRYEIYGFYCQYIWMNKKVRSKKTRVSLNFKIGEKF